MTTLKRARGKVVYEMASLLHTLYNAVSTPPGAAPPDPHNADEPPERLAVAVRDVGIRQYLFDSCSQE